MQIIRCASVLLGWLLATIGTSLAAQCTLCQDGSEVPLKEKELGRNNKAIPIKTCGELELAVGGLGDTMANCQSARAVGSFCGCPIPENACRLCGDLFVGVAMGSVPTTIDAQDYIADSPSTNMTCQSVESFLHSLEDSEEGACGEVREYASSFCCEDAVEVRVTGATEAPAPTTAPEPTDSPVLPVEILENSSVADSKGLQFSSLLLLALGSTWLL